MQYPRKMMKTTELVRECGYTYKYLLRMAHIPGQRYARKLPGGKDFYWGFLFFGLTSRGCPFFALSRARPDTGWNHQPGSRI